MNELNTKVPRHLWIVGVLSLLWNAVGAFDYSASQLRIESYMSQFTPEQLAYFYGFPAWAVAAWAIAVWGALLGSLCLLLRKAWAVWLFGASIVGDGAHRALQLRADGWHGADGNRRRDLHGSHLAHRLQPVSSMRAPWRGAGCCARTGS